MAAASRRVQPYSWLKPGVFLGSLTPLVVIIVRAAAGSLGADPIAEGLNQLGLVALVFLVASLACTPMKPLLGWTWPARIRKELGLFGFFYASLHVATYAGVDQSLNYAAILADVVKRKFIFAGFAAFACLVPLAWTSTQGALRRLGFVRWKRLHRLAYLAAALASVHFILRVKKDLREPLIYASVLAFLLLVRLIVFTRSRLSASRSSGQIR